MAAQWMRGDDHEFRSAPSVAELEELEREIATIFCDLMEALVDGFLLEALKKPAWS
jgi:hypothetical protein